jgi:hypothetical protein
MKKIYYRLASQDDKVLACSLDLREADKKEANALSGLPWELTLYLTIAHSKYTYVGIYNENIECVFGLIELENKVASPWFVTTDKFNSFGLTFAKESKKLFKEWLNEYPILTNYVSSDHTESINWLKWLGFKIDEMPIRFADPNINFYKFYLFKQD